MTTVLSQLMDQDGADLDEGLLIELAAFLHLHCARCSVELSQEVRAIDICPVCGAVQPWVRD